MILSYKKLNFLLLVCFILSDDKHNMESCFDVIHELLHNEKIKCEQFVNNRKEVYRLFFSFIDNVSVTINTMIRNDEKLRKISGDTLDYVNYYMMVGIKHASHKWLKKFRIKLKINDIEIGFMKSFRDEFIRNIKRRNKVTLYIHNQKIFFKSLNKSQ